MVDGPAWMPAPGCHRLAITMPITSASVVISSK
jgi:hypothetical protein